MIGPVFEISDAKLVDYLLDLNHKDGGPKAKFFIARGFTRNAPQVLGNALAFHAGLNWPGSVMTTAFGAKHVVTGALGCPDGTTPDVLVVWKVEPGRNVASLVTAYPN